MAAIASQAAGKENTLRESLAKRFEQWQEGYNAWLKPCLAKALETAGCVEEGKTAVDNRMQDLVCLCSRC